MRIATFFLFLGLFLQVQAQMKQPDPTVFIFVGDSIFPMNVITSQTELKKGWDIQGINVGRKIKRYFSGAQARQTTGRQPKFAIYPKTQDLNDYALIRLKERRGFRYLPASEFKDCDYTRVELGLFNIENLPGLGFAVTPLTPLFPGEYWWIFLKSPSTNTEMSKHTISRWKNNHSHLQNYQSAWNVSRQKAMLPTYPVPTIFYL